MISKKENDHVCRRVYDGIIRNRLLAAGDRVVLAFSGGPDSAALLHILMELIANYDFPLEIVPAHMNHALRGREADADQALCEEVAASRGLPLITAVLPVKRHIRRGESVEEAGRRLRYDFLLRTAQGEGAKKIAVAHHADDAAESLIMRLQRGCGLYGLAAMPPARPVAAGSGVMLIRPLLCLSKSELAGYLQERNIKFRTDRTNTDASFRRNYIRLCLLPELQNRFQDGLKAKLARINALACEIRERHESETDACLDRVLCRCRCGGLSLHVRELKSLPLHIRTALFRRAIQRLSGCRCSAPELTRRHWKELDALIGAPAGRAVSLPGGLTARREHGGIFLSGRPKEHDERQLPLHVPGRCGPIAGGIWISAALIKRSGCLAVEKPRETDPCIARLNFDKVNMPLSVRTRRTGDRFHPLGAPGSRRLKCFFIDRKIPRHRRDEIPLVLDAANRIIWVTGEEIADFCRLNGTEESILELRTAGSAPP